MTPARIIVHHSATRDGDTLSWQAIRRYHMQERGWRDIGYHFGIERVVGRIEILAGRLMTETGAHAYRQNHDSLGVCIVGNFDQAPPPKATWKRAVELVGSLVDVLGLSVDDVYGHREFSSKTCPGRRFDLEAFRWALRR